MALEKYRECENCEFIMSVTNKEPFNYFCISKKSEHFRKHLGIEDDLKIYGCIFKNN